MATIRYGYGAGSGRGNRSDASGEGGGGGGGLVAAPAGALEISANGTRFVPFVNWKLLGIAFAAGILAGALCTRRR